MTRRTTRMESCPTKVRTRQTNRDRAMASGSASLTTSRRPKKRQTKPIWNRSKAWNRKNLSQKRPGRRGGNKAKVPRGRRPESRGRAMAERLGRVAGGRGPGKRKEGGRRREVPRRVGTHRGIENGGWDGMLQEDGGRCWAQGRR